MSKLKTIHPFPARMAPELALKVLSELPKGSLVLDPMCGSGTVIRYAADLGHSAIGADLDPLAVLMARVWTRPVDESTVLAALAKLLREARRLDPNTTSLPWIDADPATANFVEYWFGDRQTNDLRRLAALLKNKGGVVNDLLRLGLSRIIITKDRGASLGRDVSHSRPHRVRDTSDFDVLHGFELAVKRILRALKAAPPSGKVRVLNQDGRTLCGVKRASVDCILTSPPYLNAIDYLRGHRLALVWLGHKVGDIRRIRSSSIGAERKPDRQANARVSQIRDGLGWRRSLSTRDRGIFDRYLIDLDRLGRQIDRVLDRNGSAVFVVGNSTLRGTYVENSEATKAMMKLWGFELVDEREREIPANSRYLPPPASSGASGLANRMRTEVVLRYRRVAKHGGL